MSSLSSSGSSHPSRSDITIYPQVIPRGKGKESSEFGIIRPDIKRRTATRTLRVNLDSTTSTAKVDSNATVTFDNYVRKEGTHGPRRSISRPLMARSFTEGSGSGTKIEKIRSQNLESPVCREQAALVIADEIHKINQQLLKTEDSKLIDKLQGMKQKKMEQLLEKVRAESHSPRLSSPSNTDYNARFAILNRLAKRSGASPDLLELFAQFPAIIAKQPLSAENPVLKKFLGVMESEVFYLQQVKQDQRQQAYVELKEITSMISKLEKDQKLVLRNGKLENGGKMVENGGKSRKAFTTVEHILSRLEEISHVLPKTSEEMHRLIDTLSGNEWIKKVLQNYPELQTKKNTLSEMVNPQNIEIPEKDLKSPRKEEKLTEETEKSRPKSTKLNLKKVERSSSPALSSEMSCYQLTSASRTNKSLWRSLFRPHVDPNFKNNFLLTYANLIDSLVISKESPKTSPSSFSLSTSSAPSPSSSPSSSSLSVSFSNEKVDPKQEHAKKLFVLLNTRFVTATPFERKEILLMAREWLSNPVINCGIPKGSFIRELNQLIEKAIGSQTDALLPYIDAVKSGLINYLGLKTEEPKVLNEEPRAVIASVAKKGEKTKHYQEYVTAFADSLRQRNLYLYSQVDASEWSTGKITPQTAPYLTALTEESTNLTNWIVETLATLTSKEEIENAIAFFFDVQKELMRDPSPERPIDFVSMTAIFSVMEKDLLQSHLSNSKFHFHQMVPLLNVFAACRKNLRQKYEEQPYFLPSISLFSKEFASLQESCPFVDENNKIEPAIFQYYSNSLTPIVNVRAMVDQIRPEVAYGFQKSFGELNKNADYQVNNSFNQDAFDLRNKASLEAILIPKKPENNQVRED